jgi:putative ABC transport system permease protein
VHARDVIGFSFGAIRLRKMRAGLTILGVMIGIAAIVSLLSFTGGLQAVMTQQFEQGLGTDTLTVSTGSVFDLFRGGSSSSDFSLLVNDTATINSMDNVEASVAVMTKSITANFSGDAFPLTLTGVNFAEYGAMYSTFAAKEGNIPVSPANTDVVIGSRVADPWQNGTIVAKVGDKVVVQWTGRVNGTIVMTNYTGTVVAILDDIGGFGLGPSDYGFYVPMVWASKFFDTNEISSITLKVYSANSGDIQTLTQNIENAFDGLVTVTQPAALLGFMDQMIGILNVFLAGIAGISLVVAGVGIMNIMIVSLIERTREIGILKGLGMHSRTVMGIFLSEAMMVGLLGGIFGIIAGIVAGNLIGTGLAHMDFSGGFSGMSSSGSNFSGLPAITPVVTPELVIGALAFGVIVSAIFGLYPAWRASKLRPVDALRYE